MGSDEFDQSATECIRHMHDQPIFIATNIEDHPIVANEVDRLAELPLDVVWIAPPRFARQREPSADRRLGLRVAAPELFQRPAGDHLHDGMNTMSTNW
jgi:hypothetical protein